MVEEVKKICLKRKFECGWMNILVSFQAKLKIENGGSLVEFWVKAGHPGISVGRAPLRDEQKLK